jgi:hypothetical protein
MGNLHGEFLSSHKISQAWPGAPDERRLTNLVLVFLIGVHLRSSAAGIGCVIS